MDTKEIKIDFPSDYADETLAGKEVIYKVTVQNVRREGELTDEWVAKNTDYTTVDDYRESIRSELEKNAKESAQEVLKNTAWSTVASSVNVPTIGLFKVTDEAKYQPYNDRSFSINTNNIDLDKVMDLIKTSLE